MIYLGNDDADVQNHRRFTDLDVDGGVLRG
jgi:hypothetical protein